MSSILVVTRNPALAMGLQRHGHDVSDVRPDRYGEWTSSAPTYDAIVLELPDPVAAEAAVQRLRRDRVGVPVLLVSNTSPGWETVAGHVGPGTQVLSLPISLPSLLASLEALVAAGPVEVPEWVEPAPEPLPEPEPEPVIEAEPEPVVDLAAAPEAPAGETAEPAEQLFDAVAASIGMTITESGTLSGPTAVPSPGGYAVSSWAAPPAPDAPAAPAEAPADVPVEPEAAADAAPEPATAPEPPTEPATAPEARTAADAAPEPAPEPPAMPEATTEATADAAPEPAPAAPEPTAEAPAAADAAPEPAAPEPAPEPAPQPAAAPTGRPAAPPPPAPGGAVVDLVTALTPRARELNSVADCAEVAVEELADRIGAQATACLVPDGDEWRVAGGRGLRSLEERLRLAADHWLVTTVAAGGQAVVIDDTDAAREPLHGAPLASWRNVLAVPIPEVRGLLVAARAVEPFDKASVEEAVTVSREAAPLLVEAVAARDLARALLPFADVE